MSEEEITLELVKLIYGKNYNIRTVIEDMLDPVEENEREIYARLTESLNEEQNKLLDDYLHLYCIRLFNMQHKRYDAGLRLGLEIGRMDVSEADADTDDDTEINIPTIKK